MATDFALSVQHGLHLTQRLYYGKDTALLAPPPLTTETSPDNYFPVSPMVYAVVKEPAMVDNPEIPSYQPYVHGRCDPPALIPLHMLNVSVDADCCFDSAVVTLNGAWRVHCVMMGKKCDCRFALPLKPQEILDKVEADVIHAQATKKNFQQKSMFDCFLQDLEQENPKVPIHQLVMKLMDVKSELTTTVEKISQETGDEDMEEAGISEQPEKNLLAGESQPVEDPQLSRKTVLN